MASETDMRRHTAVAVPSASDDTDTDAARRDAVAPVAVPALDACESNPTQAPKQKKHTTQSAIDDASASLSRNPSHESASTANRPDNPPSPQPELSRHKRFSVLRFRNASDSQLSLRAKQQAENPPPLPRRMAPSPAPSLLAGYAPAGFGELVTLTRAPLSSRHHHDCTDQRHHRPEEDVLPHESGGQISTV